MPELPEVETIRRDLEKLIVGKKILDVTTDTPKMVMPSLTSVKRQIVGTTIKKFDRRAKLLQIFLSNGKILIVHLKMTGRLLVRKVGEAEDDWQHVVFSLSGGKELRFADLRKFGWIKLITKKELKNILDDYGPEPEELNQKQFMRILSKSRRAIKVHLLDQKKLSGVGNIYVVDALNLARIAPTRPANSLTREESNKLFAAVKKVLAAGIRYRGASDNFYLDALGRKGKYQDHFLVYNRAGKPCYNCKAKVMKMKLAGRGTYYCENCQK